jgi:hypothetical protein
MSRSSTKRGRGRPADDEVLARAPFLVQIHEATSESEWNVNIKKMTAIDELDIRFSERILSVVSDLLLEIAREEEGSAADHPRLMDGSST